MELTERQKHQMRLEAATCLRTMAEKLEGGVLDHNVLQAQISLLIPDLDEHDGDLVETVLAGAVKSWDGFITVDLPYGLV